MITKNKAAVWPKDDGVLHPKGSYVYEEIAKGATTDGSHEAYHKSTEEIELLCRCQSDTADGKGKCAKELDDVYKLNYYIHSFCCIVLLSVSREAAITLCGGLDDHSASQAEMALTVVYHPKLACGDALYRCLRLNTVQIANTADSSTGEIGCMAYLEGDLLLIGEIAPDIFCDELEALQVDLITILMTGVIPFETYTMLRFTSFLITNQGPPLSPSPLRWPIVWNQKP